MLYCGQAISWPMHTVFLLFFTRLYKSLAHRTASLIEKNMKKYTVSAQKDPKGYQNQLTYPTSNVLLPSLLSIKKDLLTPHAWGWKWQ